MMEKMKTFLLFFCFCFVSQAIAVPAQVIIIRHAEKPPEGIHLSLKGRERAAALVPFFLGNPMLLRFGTPAAIYAQNAPDPDSSLRPIETVQGLAKALNVSLIDRYHHKEYPEMVEEIMTNPAYVGKMVLIAWEHHVIPMIAAAFGANSAPTKWHGDVFDRLWVIEYDVNKNVTFYDLPQRLMFEDSRH